jgi:hypothetical protein
MRTLATALIGAAALAGLSLPAAAQYHGAKASPGNCQAAIVEAERHGNVWQAPFSMEDCEAIAAKMIDDGWKMIQKSQESDDQNDEDRPRRRRMETPSSRR